jgi:hypothetical protein
LPNGDSAWALFDKPAGGGTGLRRFDWPAFLRRSETGQTNRRNTNLDGHALNGRSKTALHSAVVRLCHSRPAPFRCRFQNARSVPPSSSNLIRSAERDFDGFLILESLDFFETPSPTKSGRKKREPGSRSQMRQKTTMSLSQFVASASEILPPLAALCHRPPPDFVGICRSARLTFIAF